MNVEALVNRSGLLLLLLAFPPSWFSGLQKGAVQGQTFAAAAAPSQEVEDAEALLAKSDWKGAQAKLSLYVASHPEDSRALFDNGYAADAQNHNGEAESLYRRAIDVDTTSFMAHLSLGLLLAREGKPDEARPELASATNLNPGDSGTASMARAWRALARIDRSTDPTLGSEELLQALKLSPETLEDTLLAAQLAESAGETSAAEAAYRRVLTKDPKSADATAGLAHVLISEKQYPEAETLLRTALEQKPDDPTFTAQLAAVLVAEDKAEALPLLEKLHSAHPLDAVMTKMLAEVRAQSGDMAGSDTLYTALLQSRPADAELLVGYGQNLLRELRYPEALQAFQKATELDPADGDGWSGLAFAASKSGQASTALHALTMRSKYLPETPFTYFLWATSYDSLHNRKSAISYYQQFLASAGDKFPDQEWQARQRLLLLQGK